MSTISDEDTYTSSHTATFSETRWYERVGHFLPYLPRESPLFAAVTISLWGVAEVLAGVSGEDIALGALALPTLLTGFVVAAYRAFSKYRAFAPEILLPESAASRLIYRKGRSGWQFALARQMLLERLAAFDRTLHRITIGAEFIPATRLSLQEYTDWLQDRPTFVIRLVHSALVQCTSELPSVLASTSSEDQLPELKAGVEELAKLYELAVQFEIQGRSVQPPEAFENLHSMMHGWSAPIQNGIEQFTKILGQLASIDRKSLKAGNAAVPNFTIVFDPPQNIDEFSHELGQIDISALFAAELEG